MSPKSKKHNKFMRSISLPFRFIVKKISKQLYVKLEYRYITGHKLNLKEPKRYTEKLQYLRLFTYPKDDNVSLLASRVGLREYAKKIGFEANLVNIYGIYEKFDDIDFTKLPDSFVIKCNHASGYNEIVYDKNNIDIKALKKKFDKWLKKDYGKEKVEPHYSKIHPCIIIEELLLEEGHLPHEYKIHVFNGKAKYLYVVTGRDSHLYYNNYFIDWTPFNEAQFNHWETSKEEIKKPQSFAEAIRISELLAKDFPFVRVDLYIINNKIYISEMTFTPAKGTLTFASDNVDFTIGEWLSI